MTDDNGVEYHLSNFHHYRMRVLQPRISEMYQDLHEQLHENPESTSIKMEIVSLILKHRLKRCAKPDGYDAAQWGQALRHHIHTGEETISRGRIYGLTPLSAWHELQLWMHRPAQAIKYNRLMAKAVANPDDIELKRDVEEYIEDFDLRAGTAPASYDVPATREKIDSLRVIKTKIDLEEGYLG